jgi:hypothetical protein
MFNSIYVLNGYLVEDIILKINSYIPNPIEESRKLLIYYFRNEMDILNEELHGAFEYKELMELFPKINTFELITQVCRRYENIKHLHTHINVSKESNINESPPYQNDNLKPFTRLCRIRNFSVIDAFIKAVAMIRGTIK